MLMTACHCGAVHVEVERPIGITECNCSVCRRYGARWAYYRRETTRLSLADGAGLDRYSPGDRLVFLRCRNCGCIVMWEPIQSGGGGDRIGVNLRLIETPADLKGVSVQRLDGADSWRTIRTEPLLEPDW